MRWSLLRPMLLVFAPAWLLACGSNSADDPLPATCEQTAAALAAFAGEHSACSASAPCVGLHDLSHEALCTTVLAPAGDQARYEALRAQFAALGCGGDECGSVGVAVCNEEGQCALEDSAAACLACPETIDPVCTSGGLNARNTCVAEACFGQTVASSGPCADGPACLAAGGTCHEITDGGYFCPDGARFEIEDPQQDCAAGTFVNTCCIADWTQPCTFLGQVSMTLSLNPLTCAAEQLPVCLFTESAPTTCTQDGLVVLSTGDGAQERLDTMTTVSAASASQMTVTGSDDAGHVFTCTGLASLDISVPTTWSCETCLGDVCNTCQIEQTHGCRLP